MFSTALILAPVMGYLAGAAFASPVEVEVRGISNNYDHCWKNKDNAPVYASGSGHCRANVWTETAYTTGIENFNYATGTDGALPGISTTQFLNSAGPWHCCARCAANPDCLGWAMSDGEDCSCQIWTSNVPCRGTADLTGAFGYAGPAVTNTTGSYHPRFGSGTCNL